MKLVHVRFLTSKKCGPPDLAESFNSGRNGHTMELVNVCGSAFVHIKFTPHREGQVAAEKFVPIAGVEELTPLEPYVEAKQVSAPMGQGTQAPQGNNGGRGR